VSRNTCVAVLALVQYAAAYLPVWLAGSGCIDPLTGLLRLDNFQDLGWVVSHAPPYTSCLHLYVFAALKRGLQGAAV
jgi:hypothetical protein